MESTGAGRASGTASRTRAVARPAAGRAGGRGRGAASSGGCRRRRPARAPRSPWVTRVAAPVRISSCTPSDWALVTGPGTPIRWRLRRVAQLAVLRAPLRTAASTTTVPRVRAAISRLRRQEPPAGGRAPGRHLGDDAPSPAEVVEQVAVGGGVGAVGPAGEHRDVGAVDGERAAVGGLVDAERRAGHHRMAGPHQGAGDAGGRPRCRRSSPSGTPTTATARPSRSSRVGPLTQRPERRTAALVEELRPHQVVDLAWATRRRRARRSGGRAARPLEARPRGRARGAGWRRRGPRGRLGRVAEQLDGAGRRRARRPATRSSGRRARSAGTGRPGRAGRRRSRGPPVHAACSSGSPCLSRSAVSTSATLGASLPRRSATVHARRWTRTAPRRLRRPSSTSFSRRVEPARMMSAGDSRMVTRLVAGHGAPELFTAIRTRSRDSWSDGVRPPHEGGADCPGTRQPGRRSDGRAPLAGRRCGRSRTPSDQPRTWSTSEGPRGW